MNLGTPSEADCQRNDNFAVKTESRKSMILIIVSFVVLAILSSTAITLAFLQVNGMKREISELREAGKPGECFSYFLNVDNSQ